MTMTMCMVQTWVCVFASRTTSAASERVSVQYTMAQPVFHLGPRAATVAAVGRMAYLYGEARRCGEQARLANSSAGLEDFDDALPATLGRAGDCAVGAYCNPSAMAFATHADRGYASHGLRLQLGPG